jgi:hypothetical protein
LARNIHTSHSTAEAVAEADAVAEAAEAAEAVEAAEAAEAGTCIGYACASGNTNIPRRRKGIRFIVFLYIYELNYFYI